ncbi:hypothetical protein KVT40_006364 [Elsinoe batatas]|uniref:Uncharacterized protein n=1 Tax=Elsinoe batatas TaxID=2601811 RepID=A0A8K0PG41_9PEZI|nr:hypothetical protein KVT40_006364 [Elsinoe batatas]
MVNLQKPKRFNTLHPNWRFSQPTLRNNDEDRSYTLHEEEAQMFRLPSLRLSPMVPSQRQWWEDVSGYRSFVNKEDDDSDGKSHSDEEDPLPPPMMGASQEQDTLYDPLKQAEDDPDVVTWDGDDDPANPLNWPRKKKWTATILVSSFTLISPIASTMIAPSLEEIGEDFNIQSNMLEMGLLGGLHRRRGRSGTSRQEGQEAKEGHASHSPQEPRPSVYCIMLGTQPAIQVMALYRAYLYGLMYLVFSTYALVWEEDYDQSLTISSLNSSDSIGYRFT